MENVTLETTEIEGSAEEPPQRSLYDILFGRLTAGFSVVALTLSFFLPPDGSGVTICWIKAWFQLPCPGCGLTRSVTCVSQLEWQKAWDYHPFGPVIYALFVVNVILLVSPNFIEQHIRAAFSRNHGWLRPVYFAIVLLFLGFGFFRMFSGLVPPFSRTLVPS